MLVDTTAANDIPLACDINAIPAEQRERALTVAQQMYSAIEEVRGLPNGLAFRLPASSAMLMLIAEDIGSERLCCPFLLFTLEIPPAGGDFWLSFTGGEGVKEFLRMSFEEADLLDEAVARAAGLNVSARKNVDSVATAFEVVGELNARVAKSTGDGQ